MENKKPLDLTEIEVAFLRSHFVYKNNILVNTAVTDENNQNIGDHTQPLPQTESPQDDELVPKIIPNEKEKPGLEILTNSTGNKSKWRLWNWWKRETVLPTVPIKAKPVVKIPLKTTTMNSPELTFDDAYKIIYDTRTRTRNRSRRRRQRKSSNNDIKIMKVMKEDDAGVKHKVIVEKLSQSPISLQESPPTPQPILEPEPIIIKPKMYNTPDSLTFEQACQKVMDCNKQRYKKSIPKG
jgi:hypothetical protein